jgi:hypothetical protein
MRIAARINRDRVAASRGGGAAVIGVLVLTFAVTAGHASPLRATRASAAACDVPSLTGLTLRNARARAIRAGCTLRLVDVQPPGARARQRVVQQVPTSGVSARPIRVWLAPRCPKPGPTSLPAREPLLTVGPTELISGFYVVGGPVFPPWICPRVPEPEADTITVIEPTTGMTVGSATVGEGQLAVIPLAPGTYEVQAAPATPVSNLGPPTTDKTVTIPAGMSVREDFIAAVP